MTNGFVDFHRGFAGAGLLAMRTTRRNGYTAAIQSRASPLPQICDANRQSRWSLVTFHTQIFFYSQVMDTTVVTGSMQPVVCG